MALPHAPFTEAAAEHSPFLPSGGGGGLTLAEVLEILAGTKNPKSIRKAALSEEVNELLGKGGPPSGAAGGVLSGTYPNPGLAAEAVTTAAIKLLAITAALLGAESVETAKIKLKAITSALIEAGAILAEHLAPESVTTAKIKLLAITAALLGEESVETGKIKNEAVTEGKLSAAVQALLAKPLTWTAVEALNASLEAVGAPYTQGYEFAVSPNGIIYLRGVQKAKVEIAAKAILFIIPVAGRPTVQRTAVWTDGKAGGLTSTTVLIKTNGEVETQAKVGANVQASIDGANFAK